MALISFFKTPKPKQFNYIPRYYDPHKEEMEERKKRIAQELGINSGSEQEYIPDIKGKMRHIFKLKSQETKKSNIRILIILLFLILLVYLIFIKL